MAELAVTMEGLQPVTRAQINGTDADFLVDSGAFYSMLSRASAAEYKLKLDPAPYYLTVRGVSGGSIDVWVATVKNFGIAGASLKNIEFLVGGNDVGRTGIIGQNILHVGDVEYDLAKGVIRLMHPEGCSKRVTLAYWVTKTDAYSEMEIELATPQNPQTVGAAQLNGAKISVTFDSGASNSLLSLSAAKRAGVTPETVGVTDAGFSAGVDRKLTRTWIAPFASFKIGDEEIRNTRLRIGETRGVADMLIGADFLLSHHVYVANSQHKVYFTYSGGPVFNLTATPRHAPNPEAADASSGGGAPPVGTAPSGAASGGASSNSAVAGGDATSGSAAPGAASSPSGTPAGDTAAGGAAAADAKAGTAEPSDAAGFSRRGMAEAARRDFTHAIADLTRACELAPQESEYFYQRAVAHAQNGEIFLAMSDLDAVLKLKPDNVSALVARAEMKLKGNDPAGAKRDLDAADGYAAKEAQIRLAMGRAYSAGEFYDSAIAQLDLWIASHREDAALVEAYNSRCWARAVAGLDPSKGLGDCNSAVRLAPDASVMSARARDSRGLLQLRLGHYDEAITDYDVSLRSRSNNAFALYGRGVAKMRLGKSAEGQADIAAANALSARAGELFSRHGILP